MKQLFRVCSWVVISCLSIPTLDRWVMVVVPAMSLVGHEIID